MTPSELRELEEIQKRHDTSAPIHCEKAARTREENARAILSYNKCREDRATLISLIESLRAREGWLPIESAPRDGTLFLGNWCGKVCVVCWNDECENWQEYPDGDFECIAGEELTHWMPLPKAPSPPSTPEQG